MPTINERLEAAKAALVEAKDGEDAEALSSAIAEFKAAEAAKKSADEADALIASLANPKEEKKMDQTIETPKSLGEFALKNLDLDALKRGAIATRTGFARKSTGSNSEMLSVHVVDNQRTMPQPAAERQLRDLFAQVTISGNAYNYVRMGATTKVGNIVDQPVPEAGAKQQLVTSYAEQMAYLSKLAAWWYETDELLEDNELLRSVLDARGRKFVALQEDGYIFDTLATTQGIGTVSVGQNATPVQIADAIFGAMMQVKSSSGFDADAIIIDASTYQTLRTAKDGGTTGQYYGGGYVYGPYGNGGIVEQPGIWGLPVQIVPTADPVCLVGAFRSGAAVVSKAGEGINVEVHRGDHDDAIHNRVTVVCEERIALAIYDPSAFTLLTFAG